MMFVPRHAPHGACELKLLMFHLTTLPVLVTLPTERVSWNHCEKMLHYFWLCVTLPTERVSWNCRTFFYFVYPWVTLPTERVSWNAIKSLLKINEKVTLPTERVSWNWWLPPRYSRLLVTLPTERVSWNERNSDLMNANIQSRSPRSVWVEISTWLLK